MWTSKFQNFIALNFWDRSRVTVAGTLREWSEGQGKNALNVLWRGVPGKAREVLHGVGADGVGVKFPHFCSKLLLFALVH